MNKGGKVGKIARRTFLIGSTAIAGGFAVGYYYYRKPYPNPLAEHLGEGERAFNPYVKIDGSNRVTIITPRAEMGQGIHTTLAALVAEELDVAWADIHVEHGPAGNAYYSTAVISEGGPFASFDTGLMAQAARGASKVIAKFMALQITGGSSSIIDHYERMREAGAMARHMLIAAAATRLSVPAAKLETRDGRVIDPASGIELTYGELAGAAADISPPGSVELKPRSSWRYLGKAMARLDARDKSMGTARFGIDVELPGMVFGTVRMNPHLGGKMISFDDTRAAGMKGVIKIVDMGHGVGVIADNTWRAFKAAEAVDITWGEAPYPSTSAEILNSVRERARTGEGDVMRDDGDVAGAISSAPEGQTLDVEYSVPYLAHACMEPMNATARFRDGQLDVWAGNQSPTIVQMVGARECDVAQEDVRVHTTLMGGGFGRRTEPDFSQYAIVLAKHSEGRPVKVTWSREEDIRHDAYRPCAVARARARVIKNVGPGAVDLRICAPSVMKSAFSRYMPGLFSPPGPDRLIVEGAFDQPYKIANYRVEGIGAQIPVPVGFWRSVGNSHNGFFHECFMDEIARHAGVDPLEMRLNLVADYPVATRVLKKVGEMSGWGSPLPEGHGRGLAFTLSFRSWVAEVVEVAQTNEGIVISKVWCACDIGRALDPGIVTTQFRSSIIFGLSAAVSQEISISSGMVEQSNFHDFDAMRMDQCPMIEVAILETAERLGGVGEPGTPPAAPALANAIYDATGTRIRDLPLANHIEFVS